MKFSFGSDPEFVIVDEHDNICSAIDVLKGSKDEPVLNGKNKFFYDNVLAECTITPSKTNKEAVESFRNSLLILSDMAKPYKIKPLASAKYNKKQMLHPMAQKINCDKEICAYELKTIEVDEEVFKKSNLRTAGGHIHIGGNIDGIEILSIVRMLDLFLGIPTLFLDKDPTRKPRKEFYGQAGRFRTPEHGLEYRSLSNYWTASPELVSLIFDISKFTYEYVKSKKHEKFWFIDLEKLEDENVWAEEDFNIADYHICTGYDAKLLIKTIGNADKSAAAIFMKMVESELPDSIFSKIKKLSNKRKPFDLYKSWF